MKPCGRARHHWSSDCRRGPYKPAAREFARQVPQFLELKPAMANFTSFADLRAACLDLPRASGGGGRRLRCARTQLTKPPRSLGRLEDIVAWLARWQGAQSAAARSRRHPGICRKSRGDGAGRLGLSGGGDRPDGGEFRRRRRRHQPARTHRRRRACGSCRLSLEQPTADFTMRRRWTRPHFWPPSRPATMRCRADADLVCLGEMGIGNTTAAAAIAAALFGGGGARWAGRGTGVDDRGLRAQAGGDRRGARASCRRARRSAGGRGGARRARARGDSRRDAGGAAAKHSGAARRLCLARRRRRRSRSCVPMRSPTRWPAMPRPKPATGRCCRSSGSRRCSISTCGSAKPPARRWRCWCCARRSPVTRNGDLRRGRRVGQAS